MSTMVTKKWEKTVKPEGKLHCSNVTVETGDGGGKGSRPTVKLAGDKNPLKKVITKH